MSLSASKRGDPEAQRRGGGEARKERRGDDKGPARFLLFLLKPRQIFNLCSRRRGAHTTLSTSFFIVFSPPLGCFFMRARKRARMLAFAFENSWRRFSPAARRKERKPPSALQPWMQEKGLEVGRLCPVAVRPLCPLLCPHHLPALSFASLHVLEGSRFCAQERLGSGRAE